MPKPVVLKPLDIGADGTIESFTQGHGAAAEEEEPVAMDFSRKTMSVETGTGASKMAIVKPLDFKQTSTTVVGKPAPATMDFFGLGKCQATGKIYASSSARSRPIKGISMVESHIVEPVSEQEELFN